MLALVVGTGRNGTTLVQDVLSQHPGVGFVSTLDDRFPRFNLSGRFNSWLYRRTPLHDSRPRLLAERLNILEKDSLKIGPSEAYSLFDYHVMAGFSTPCRDLLADDLTPYIRARLVDFFHTRMEQQRCRVFLQHLTGWPRTGLLSAAFPDLRVINVVRDGRAVVNSWLQTDWWNGWRGPDNWIYGPLPDDLRDEWEASGRSFVVLAALGWVMLMRAYETARELVPADQWLDLRYEELVADPRSSFANALEFLGLGWCEEFEQGYGRHRIVTTSRERFREELTARQIDELDRVLAETLATWGYA